jgi:hypothetical protein
VLRELAVGIFVHDTYPFFSLHFNDEGCLYPVIHPSYQNTLVGEVISMLDYYMKGYLNGGFFMKDFLDAWNMNPNYDRNYLRGNLIDIKKYLKQHGLADHYTSLRERTGQRGLDEGIDSSSIYTTKFRTSFRIISKLDRASRHGNTLMLDPSFEVFYSIDLMPDYKEFLERHMQ